jgi:hypothetical protein
MSRKTRILSLSLICACGFVVSSASAQFLAGNVWPNPDFSTAAAPGVDQVYSYYNTPFYTPNATGDTNPRPDGWHRGGGDFGVTTAPSYCFYNTPGNAAGEGTPPAGMNYALEETDSNVTNNGEWFSDWNALPVGPGNTLTLQFFYQVTGVEPRGDTFRVSAYFGDSTGSDVLNAPNQIGNSTDFLIAGGSPDVTTWTQVDETITVPAGAESMRITMDTGGTGAATGDLWLADISVAPEPASMALLSAGALLLARRRRA